MRINKEGQVKISEVTASEKKDNKYLDIVNKALGKNASDRKKISANLAKNKANAKDFLRKQKEPDVKRVPRKSDKVPEKPIPRTVPKKVVKDKSFLNKLFEWIFSVLKKLQFWR